MLLVFVIMMSIWVDECKLGMDEILFIFFVLDLEVLLGKYLLVFVIYVIGVFFLFM